MSDRLVCITRRTQCPDDFLSRIESIASMHPYAIVLREKDLSYDLYMNLAHDVYRICDAYKVPLWLNWKEPTVLLADCGVQLPFLHRHAAITTQVSSYGISIHSPQEAVALIHEPCHWLFAGHIFPTTCKPNLAPRGISFLRTVTKIASQPVFAIGGITPMQVPEVLAAGAYGYCVMGALMTHPDPQKLIADYRYYEGVYNEQHTNV